MESSSQVFPFAWDSTWLSTVQVTTLQQACCAGCDLCVHPDSVHPSPTSFIPQEADLQRLASIVPLALCLLIGFSQWEIGQIIKGHKNHEMGVFIPWSLSYWVIVTVKLLHLTPQLLFNIRLLQRQVLGFAPWAQEWWWFSVVSRRLCIPPQFP